MDIVIRHAAVSDAEALSSSLNTLSYENLDTVRELRYSPAEEAEVIEKAARNGRAFSLLALDDTKVVGVLDLWAVDMPLNRHAGRLGMSVLASYQRKAIGRKLLKRAIDETRDWPGFCRIELDVVPWNTAAIRLYESAGFVREGTNRKGAVFRDKLVDLIQMALVW